MALAENYTSTTLTILFDGKYWMALFERRDQAGYSVAKATISKSEPQTYQVEDFLQNLDYTKLQFTPSGNEPVTTKTIVIEKKQKFEKTHTIEVALKNTFGDAKKLLHKQKNDNRILRREKEYTLKREEEKHKQDLKLANQIDKHKGK